MKLISTFTKNPHAPMRKVGPLPSSRHAPSGQAEDRQVKEKPEPVLIPGNKENPKLTLAPRTKGILNRCSFQE
jgi:hypothetical protein